LISSNPKNLCHDYSADKAYCYCENKCEPCYNEKDHIKDNKQLIFVPIRENSRSLGCSKSYYNGLQFQNALIVEKFQQTELNNERRSLHWRFSGSELSNRDLMPRLCMQLKHHNDLGGLLNLRIVLNDFHFVASSLLFNEKPKYKLRLYTYGYVRTQALSPKNLHSINTTLVHEEKVPITGDQVLEIMNLHHGKYIIEVKIYVHFLNDKINERF
jgi:hypothetical protein